MNDLVKSICCPFIEYIHGLPGLQEEDDKRPWHKPQHLLVQSGCDCGQHDGMEAPAHHQTTGEVDAKKCGVCVDPSATFHAWQHNGSVSFLGVTWVRNSSRTS